MQITTSKYPDISIPEDEWGLYEIELNQMMQNQDTSQTEKFQYGKNEYDVERHRDDVRANSLNEAQKSNWQLLKDGFLATIGITQVNSAEPDFTPSMLNVFDYAIEKPIQNLFKDIAAEEAYKKSVEEHEKKEEEDEIIDDIVNNFPEYYYYKHR